jgi:hypothetical protein
MPIKYAFVNINLMPFYFIERNNTGKKRMYIYGIGNV